MGGREAGEVKVAVIGAGAWGRNLVRNFYALGALEAVCDLDPRRLAEVEGQYPGVRTTTALEEVLGSDEIRAVAIATPAPTHAELALKAIEAGKDVLVEKPMALSVGDGERLVEEAERRGLILMVGHVLEYHPAVLKLRELVSEGALGKLEYIYSNRLNFGRFRREENALWSFAPHDVALLLRLVGEMPKEVSAHGAAYLNHDVADVTVSNFVFPGGVRAHIFVSWLHPYKEQRLVVIGDRAMAVFEDTLPWPEKLRLYKHKVEWVEGRIPVAAKEEAEPVPVEEVEPLRAECEHFLECVAERKRPLTDGRSGLKVLRVLEACQESLDRGGERVALPPEGRKYFVHPTATVDPGAEIGEGTKVWHYAHVMSGAKVGRNCVLGQNVFVAKNAVIGDGVKIQNNVSVYEGVVLEDYVFCGPSMVFTNVKNPRSEVERKHEFRRTLVKRGATLGANCTIVCGVTIGRYAFVGAGAVVTRDVPDYALVVGVPARIVGWVCECGERLREWEGDVARCPACGKTYRKVAENEVARTG